LCSGDSQEDVFVLPERTERSKHMTTKPGTVYRKTELVGTSSVGYDDAIKQAVERAHKTLRNMEWFEVKEQRGRLTNGTIEYQVSLEVGFALEDTLA
jgi:flavin-binding protein dodecin